MKKYYLHIGTENSGPFDIEELKEKKLTKTSPVWFEGMQQWKTAGEIPELNQLFIPNPPPFSPFSTPEPEIKVEKESKEITILGMSKNNLLIVVAAIIILIGITVLKVSEENRSRELKLKNHKTEIENYKLEQKQKQLEEDKIQAVIQEKINSERSSRDLKLNANNRLVNIKQQIANYKILLSETENKLKSTSGFKLFRSGSEKKKQTELLEKNIKSIKTNIILLTQQSDQLYLELEKIE